MNKNILYILSLSLPILADQINKRNLIEVSIGIIVLGLVILMFNLKKGSIYFFIMSLSFSDFTFESVFRDNNLDNINLGGIYMGSFAGTTLMVYWTLILTIVFFTNRLNKYIPIVKKNSILKLLTICFFFSLMMMPFNLLSDGKYVIQTIISDLRIFINVFIGYFVIHEIVKDDEDLKIYFNCFFLIILVQIGITLISSYTLSSSRTLYNFIGGTESFFVASTFIFLLSKLSVSNQTNDIFSIKVVNILGLLMCLLFLFIVASRGRLVGLAILTLIFVIYNDQFKFFFLLPIGIYIAIEIVIFINPNFMNYFIWKITTFNPLEEGGDSSRVRYISLLNILDEQIRNPIYLIFGKGFGSFFEAKNYSFQNLLGQGSFNQAWINEGKFYKPHGILLYSLLKYGSIMTVLLLRAIFIYSWKELLKAKKRLKSKSPNNLHFDNTIMVTVLISLPYIFIIMFSSKLQIMFGMILAFSYLNNPKLRNL